MLWLSVAAALTAVPPRDGATKLASLVADAVWSDASSVELRVERTSAPKVYGRAIQVKKRRQLQLTFKCRGACDVVRNYGRDRREGRTLTDNIGPEKWVDAASALEVVLQDAAKATAIVRVGEDEWVHSWSGRDMETTKRPAQGVATTAHDRVKRRALAPTAPFLNVLNLTDASGKARPGRSKKLAQIQRFAELLDHALAKLPGPLRVLDAGCGHAYLTFAAHELLKDKGVRIIGVDRRRELVEDATRAAARLGYSDLEFRAGSIEDFDEPFDVLIALHACDTATDDALFAAITSSAKAVVCAPCCHKEIRPQLEAHKGPLLDVVKHGVLADRHAEAVTDSLRALLLEIAGYHSPKIIEWTPLEHTAKNTMLVATRAANHDAPRNLDALRARLKALAKFHGVTTQRLATLMNEPLSDVDPRPTTPSFSSRRRRRGAASAATPSVHRMPDAPASR